ncbi:GNAT family N-acetyltransferase [Bifidobacterium platyrrhinorum]|uniref:GNAT family N-acetyltransferase n=1 Tax=Bifidobacterium platyrrhinorum TaxID=2661628 RepID=A0A6L9SV69_9BIFI|nr:GNAT family N-acetyltransferase [Bifidobacterium platyrrhinorum]NEG56039.1 GNAT family N-acetyltransferase [Bifidobacterium platyrrhinorum]
MRSKRNLHPGKKVVLKAPTMADLEDLHRMYADPRTWWNRPNHRHLNMDHTRIMLESWIEDWKRDDIGYWVMRERNGAFVGAGGIRRRATMWNMSYSIMPGQWHRGYATYVARCATLAARRFDGTAPIFLTTLAKNLAACLIADKLDFVVVRNDFDLLADAEPRRIYADRPVYDEEIRTYLDSKEIE